MCDLRTVLICFIGLAFLPGRIKSGKITKDDCSSRFLTSLIEAGYKIDNKVDLTINLKYEDDKGAKKKAAIKLRDQCREPKILCDGETNVLNEEIVTGPLLLCSWKWNEKDDTTANYVIVRLNHKKAIEISGSVSRDSVNVFPHASDKGPLDFKFITPNWNGEGGKKTYRIKREEDRQDYEEEEEEEEEEDRDDTEEEKNLLNKKGKVRVQPPTSKPPPPTSTSTTPSTTPPPPPPTTVTEETTTVTEETTTSAVSVSKAESFFHVNNKLSYGLWMTWVSLIIFVLK